MLLKVNSMQESATNKFLKGISTQSIISLLNGIFQIAVFSILSRLLTKEDFGYYATLIGVTSIFVSISDAGIGSALIQSKNTSKQFVSTAFTLGLCISLMMGIFFLLFAPLIAKTIADDTIVTALRIMSIPLILYGLNSFAISSLKKNLHFKQLGVCKLTSYIFSSFIAIAIAYFGGGFYALIALFLLESLVFTILLYHKVRIPRLYINAKDAKSILSFGGWLTFGVVLTAISNQMDKLVLGKWLSIEKLGAYNRPSGFISHIINQLNSIFDSVLFPILSTVQDSREQFCNVLYRSFELITVLGSTLAACLYINSDLIISIFFGNRWMDLSPILKVISLSAFFMLHNTLADCFIRSFNLVKVGFYIRLFGVVLFLSALYIGAKYGIFYVAISVLISNAIIVFVKLLYLSIKSGAKLFRLFEIFIRESSTMLPVFFLGVVFTLFPNNLICQLVECILCIITILIVYLFFPRYIGKEYSNMIYPKVKLLLKKKVK